MSKLTHLDDHGAARMVDVGGKPQTARRAVAHGHVGMSMEAITALMQGDGKKGDVLGTARVAGIMAAKRTHELIPLCHGLALSSVQVDLMVEPAEQRVRIVASVEAVDRTGVEMEALTAVSVAALTVYDMLKAVDRGMEIGGVELLEKDGGRSGSWRRPVKVVAKQPAPPASPRVEARSAAPRPQQPSAAPRPQRHSAAPRPQRHSAVSVPPRPAPPPQISTPPSAVPAPSTRRHTPPLHAARPVRRSSPPPRPPAVIEARLDDIEEVDHTDERLRAYLRAKPIEQAYMLGDLDPLRAEHCKWWVLPGDGGALDAVGLLYSGLRMPALLTSGDTEAVHALLHAVRNELPVRCYAQLRTHHVPAVEQLFRMEGRVDMVRMGLTRDMFLAAGSDEGVQTIGHRDTPSLMALYAHYPDNFFDPAQLETGLYCGIWEGKQLVSVAGLHVLSEAYDIAAIGNIVTHTDHRGRGLATRCVRGLLDRLLPRVGHVALNVSQDNEPAVACYRKFGFSDRYRFVEAWLIR